MSDFSVAAVFSDHMVLQRDKNISVFGCGEDGESVFVSFRGCKASAVVKNGRWCAVLPPMSAGVGDTLSVSYGSKTVCFTDVAVGEVWLAGGQSNMEFELRNCREWDSVKELPADNQLRFYYTQKKAVLDDDFFASEAQTKWSVSGGEDFGVWSAVAYFFAVRLKCALGVPVGIIGCNWGGTSASAWTDMESLARDSELNSYVSEYLDAVGGKTVEEQVREYTEYTAYHAEFERRSAELYSQNPDIEWDEVQRIIGECRYPGPMNCVNPLRPAGLYECMVKRVAPYSLRGFIFYQGESDDHKPLMYSRLFRSMIDCWRRKWEDDTLPFLFVQLPMHRYRGEPDKKNWPFIREAQAQVCRTVRGTSMAVAIDQGEWNEIHPKTKHVVGERLAFQALCDVYGIISPNDANGPLFRSCVFTDGCAELFFDHAGGGFVCSSGSPVGFEVAGADGKYYPADAELSGSVIRLTCPQIEKPEFVRYLWTNYSEVTLFGSNGIPLAPFRSSISDGSEDEIIL